MDNARLMYMFKKNWENVSKRYSNQDISDSLLLGIVYCAGSLNDR